MSLREDEEERSCQEHEEEPKMGEKEDTEDCSGGAPDDVESAPATPPATAPSGVAVTPEPVEALADYVDPLNEAVKAVGSVLSRKFVDPFAEEIKKLKDERAELNKARRAAQRKLKNETRKRKRLVEKASALSATELVHVLHEVRTCGLVRLQRIRLREESRKG